MRHGQPHLRLEHLDLPSCGTWERRSSPHSPRPPAHGADSPAGSPAGSVHPGLLAHIPGMDPQAITDAVVAPPAPSPAPVFLSQGGMIYLAHPSWRHPGQQHPYRRQDRKIEVAVGVYQFHVALTCLSYSMGSSMKRTFPGLPDRTGAGHHRAGDPGRHRPPLHQHQDDGLKSSVSATAGSFASAARLAPPAGRSGKGEPWHSTALAAWANWDLDINSHGWPVGTKEDQGQGPDTVFPGGDSDQISVSSRDDCRACLAPCLIPI